MQALTGSGATIIPRDGLRVVLPDLRSADSVSEPAGPRVALVARPDAPAAPAITLMGPAAIGVCDTAEIDVSSPLLVTNSIISSASVFQTASAPAPRLVGWCFCGNCFNADGAGLRLNVFFCEVRLFFRCDLPCKRMLTRSVVTTDQAAVLSPRACTFEYSCM